MFNLPNPGSNPANPYYHRSIEEQRREMQEAVTVELDFKSDAEGKKAGGKMIRKGVYRMTFKNNAEMNKFMDTHADKLNESTEELVKESRDDFDYLDVEAARQDARAMKPKVEKTKFGFQVMVFSPKAKKFIAQGTPHKTKAAAEKDAKMFEDVEQVDEMSAKKHYEKMIQQDKLGGKRVTPIDRDRFPNREKEGLEGPYRSKKSGQVYYYDRKAGKYYDPLSDMFLQVKDVMETKTIDKIDDYLSEGSE
jgi:hypothetical protein